MRVAPLLVFLVLILGVGAVHGLRTDRWSTSNELQAAVANLEGVPLTIGDWTGKDIEYSPVDMARGGIHGCVHRTYSHRLTGATVSLLIVCGRGGPICAHTPDVCYAGMGYQLMGSEKRYTPGPAADHFWHGQFNKPNAAIPQRLDIYWGWSRDGAEWSAPNNQRVTFARYHSLYKLYVVRNNPQSPDAEEAIVRDFLQRLLAELRTVLGSSKSSTRNPDSHQPQTP